MADINLPNEIILPIPETVKEQDLYKTLQDYVKDINNSFSAMDDIEAITAGSGITDTSNTFSINVDDTTIEISGDSLQVKDGGISKAKLSANSVDGTKLEADSVDGTKIADDSIDSEHYVAGSIDNEHLAANSVDSDNYVDGSIDTVHIGNNQVTSAKLENDLAFSTFPTTPASAPDADYEVANKKYVDDNIPSSGLSFISKTTMSSSTNSGDISITQGIKYKIVYNLTNAGAATSIKLRFNNDTGAHYGNSGESSTPSTEIDISPSIAENTSEGFASGSFIMTPVVTDQMIVVGENGYEDTSYAIQISNIVGFWNNNTTVSSFEIFSDYNISGDILLYKYNES